MVRLQKRFAYKYPAKDGERIHYKHIITIPEEAVNKLKWDSGVELDVVPEKGQLIIKPKEVQRKVQK